ncbi:MAG: TetR family transcriptional regulator, partial [Steroidobacteraceae bacterium]
MPRAKPLPGSDSAEIFSRGEPSRRALLIAGATVFGEKGLDGATTREIAARAGQNISAIAYYFGGKQGLYLAIAREIGVEISQRLGPIADAAAHEQPDAAAAMELLKRVLTIMIRTMLIAEGSAAIAHFIVREQQHP